jgi:hypothetical protein
MGRDLRRPSIVTPWKIKYFVEGWVRCALTTFNFHLNTCAHRNPTTIQQFHTITLSDYTLVS